MSGLAWALLAAAYLVMAMPVFAAPARQATPAAAAPGQLVLPVLTPVEQAGISLHTHLVQLSLQPTAEGAATVSLQATYKLHNDGKEPATVTLRVPPSSANSITLTGDDMPLALQPGADGALTAAVTVPNGVPVTVQMMFETVLPATSLMEVDYPTNLLAQWPGQVSLRMDILPAAALPPASWLRVEPAEWDYAPPSIADEPAIEWLFDGDLPDQILFQFAGPGTWQQIQQAEQAAVAGAPLTAFLALGDLYTSIAADATGMGNATAAERYYGQAVAAYSDGIRQAGTAGGQNPELAQLHRGLAALYRNRVANTAGSSDAIYAELMAREAGAALAAAAADDPHRAELEQWQAEGLRLLLADTRRRGDIGGALQLIDRLSASDTGTTNAEFLASERKALVVQQALELLDKGDREAALALAGSEISDPALQPPDDLQSLFLRWAATAAISDSKIELVVDATPQLERYAQAQQALKALVELWHSKPTTRNFDVQLEQMAEQAEQPALLRLKINLPAGSTGVALAELTPARADWALLKQLLTQLGPKLDSQTDGLRQQVHVSQPVDLRSAGSQWMAVAQNLDDQAAALDAQATSTGAAETVTLDASLQARIRAANYRHAAQTWRNLGRDSHVAVLLRSTGNDANAARTWLVTTDSPPQMLDVQVESLNLGRVMLAIAGVGIVILLLAGLLWRLL